MPRAVAEWIGKNDDIRIPTRVKVRLFEKASGRCQCCERKLFVSDKWQADHIVALINGGTHRESNLQVLCDWCHRRKTIADVALKSKMYRKKAKHFGMKTKPKSKPLPGTLASGWKHKINGTWERR